MTIIDEKVIIVTLMRIKMEKISSTSNLDSYFKLFGPTFDVSFTIFKNTGKATIPIIWDA